MHRPNTGVTLPARAGSDHGSWMLTSLLLWLCALPLVGLLILPQFGARVALIAAALLLAGVVGACYGVCVWQAAGPRRGGEDA